MFIFLFSFEVDIYQNIDMKSKSSIFTILFLFFSQLTISQTLKIITINTWSGLDYAGTFSMGEYEDHPTREKRINVLVNELKRLSPDVIFLQEANPVASFAGRVADELNFDEIHQVCNAGIKIARLGIPANLNEGIAILARKELKLKEMDAEKLSGSFGIYGDLMSLHFDESNFVLPGKIIVNNTPILLINTHLSSFPEYSIENEVISGFDLSFEEKTELRNIWIEKAERRKDEINNLINAFEYLPEDMPFVLGGDFNCVESSNEIKTLKAKLNLTDVMEGSNAVTWEPEGNPNINYSTDLTNAKFEEIISAKYDSVKRRIDFIFINDHFKPGAILNSMVVKLSEKNIYASDHYGVFTELAVADFSKKVKKEYNYLAESDEFIWEAFPIASYDTDVGFGYGGKLFLLNPFSINESVDIILFNSTKGEKWYRAVFSYPDYELRQGKIYPISMDLTFDYDKYINTSFYGIGSRSDLNDEINFTKEFIDFNLIFSRGLTENFVASLGLRYKSIDNSDFENAPINTLEYLGKVKYLSFLSSIRYDSRNSFINPSSGLVFQANYETAPRLNFNDASFNSLSVNLNFYKKLFYPKSVFAFKTAVSAIDSKEILPIHLLNSLGGNQSLRGYPQDRFLDKVSWITNLELRYPIYWRFGGIVGVDAGRVFSKFSQISFNEWRINPVIGLRFYMDTFVIRADLGLGNETTGFYFNFGHIF